MLRSLSEVAALFALPFLIYFAIVFIRGRPIDALRPNHVQHVPKLILAGILCAAIGILLIGYFEDRTLGTYVPAQYRDGKLIPGRLQ